MKRYVIDSNLYIEAVRDRRVAPALAEFCVAYAPNLMLHAVVVQELLAGATSSKTRRHIERNLVQPLERRGRLLVPGYQAWKRAGEIIADLVAEGELTAGGVPRSFPNDALIASSCREAGVTLITRNARDFERIGRVEPVQFITQWPGQP